MLAMAMAERGLVPQPLVRVGIRRLLRSRLASETSRQPDPEAALARFVRSMAASEVAPLPHLANRQHYEVPASFFQIVLGRHMKYSACHWEPGTASLDEAESAMLSLTAERAGISDGQRILDLGCGWGSLTFWLAERYPGTRVTAVSNSSSQGAFIRAGARARGLANVEVLTADVNGFSPRQRFDRVVSVEMFEHMRNWPELLKRIGGWLEPSGRLFVHVFTHRRFAYPFEIDGDGDWMARHFFTGGIMPSRDLLPRIGGPLEVERTWHVPGSHYARTAEAWRERLDLGFGRAVDALSTAMPRREATIQAHRWRLFFLACAELFGFAGGEEWAVTHYRLRPAEGA
ncbi:MAG TPA: cyclopropane-fatty-acyl-phospholipid synthase family protein [Anaeromyxobacteraceae bacterium]|nr:cyclopropane-fatty-acyl-phospholipid synthase family protein [Anaeromyxobacteraceae bacterium]